MESIEVTEKISMESSVKKCCGGIDELVDGIEVDGYCLIRGLLTADQILKARELVIYWEQSSSMMLSTNRPNNAGADRYVVNLQNKDPFFLELVLRHPILMELCRHFLNDPWYKQIPPDTANFILRSLIAKAGMFSQRLHLDTFLPHPGKYPCMLQVIIALEHQSIENGCVVVVPGSHLSGDYVDQKRLKDTIPVEYEAGDAFIFDSRLWHGSRQDSERARWMLIAAFCRWWHKQTFDPYSLPQEIYQYLSDEEKSIVGFCSIPPRTEFENFDCKRGFDALPEKVGND